MKLYLLIIAILFLSPRLLGQNINSKIWDKNSSQYDYIPDTVLYQPPDNQINIIDIDLDQDGTNDFRLKSLYKDGSQWYNEYRLTIESFNNNQIAYSQSADR